jgi:YidC/Oxa1 family membrane protein insertase
MEDRQGRLFLALFLSLAIWMGINMVFFPNQDKAKPSASNTETTSEKSIELKQTPNATLVAPTKPTREIIPVVQPKDIKTSNIITNSFLVRFSNLGGRIEEFYIKNYADNDGNEVQIIKNEKDHIDFADQKFPAIEISRGQGFDFNISDYAENVFNTHWNQSLYQMDVSQDGKNIKFTAKDPSNKFSLTKEYQFFEKENYFLFKLHITNLTNSKVVLNDGHDVFLRSFSSLGPTKVLPASLMSDRDRTHYFRFFYLDGSFKDYVDSTTTEGFFDSFFGSGNKDKNFDIRRGKDDLLDFAGSGSRYFIGVIDPLKDNKPSGVVLDNRKDNETGPLLIYDALSVEPGATRTLEYAAYTGIREADGMAFRDPNLDPNKNDKSPFYGLSKNLDKSFNQGLTTPFRNGIVWFLKKLHDYAIPNYGWSIIVFSILFKLVFYPLNQKQAESMKKMQELSPQIQQINEKYDKDPTTKQQKIMELYKKNNTNPMSGCLPMLIQIPIFIALYTAFSDTVDLWNSPFLWVDDLSEPDTIFTTPPIMGFGGIALNLLPLLMVATQFFQTRMTTVSSDPNQKMMMYMMPILMLYFFWSMPSGVTLYWTMQNVLSIAQQTYTNKFGKEAKSRQLEPTAPPAKKAAPPKQIPQYKKKR